MDGEAEAQQHARVVARAGLFYALAAHTWWGLIPVYFKALGKVPPAEVLAHRILWSLAFLITLIGAGRRFAELKGALRSSRTLLTLVATSLLVGANWYLFIFAIARGELLEASLGYFINPLVNVLFGFVFLGERLRRLQTASVLLAAVAVVWLTLRYGGVPWIALVLAVTFGFYTLLRKTARIGTLEGLTIETGILAPIAAFYLFGLPASALRSSSLATGIMLVGVGVVTTLPLLWFTAAARRLRLGTLGVLQYISPSMQFILAVVAFGEPFTPAHVVTFRLIWSALALYSFDALRTLDKPAPQVGS